MVQVAGKGMKDTVSADEENDEVETDDCSE